MTAIRMSVATVTALLAAKLSLCAVTVYNHRLGRRIWRYNRSIKPAPGLPFLRFLSVDVKQHFNHQGRRAASLLGIPAKL